MYIKLEECSHLRVACSLPRSPGSAADKADIPDLGALPLRCRLSDHPALCHRHHRYRDLHARSNRSNSRSWRVAVSDVARASAPRPTTPTRRSPSRHRARFPLRSHPWFLELDGPAFKIKRDRSQSDTTCGTSFFFMYNNCRLSCSPKCC